MKTLFATLAMVVFLGAQSFAGTEDTTRVAKKELKNSKEILTPDQEILFETGRLNETLVQPIYSSVEQLIFTEMVRKLKDNN
jgi:hypothetical protein